jgi:hypothetical protein
VRIASFTTAKARTKLISAMSLIDPIYCDTDSIVFRKKDLHNLEEKGLIGKTLGKFAREYEAIFCRLIFWQLNVIT